VARATWTSRRRYCRCGAMIQIRSDPQTVAHVIGWWLEVHTGSRHGTATARQAATARIRQARDLAQKREDAGA
jgi:hypothetical protein